MKVVLTPIAETDLVSVFDWLAQRDKAFACAYVDKLQAAVMKFGEFPRLGVPRPEWGTGVRARFVDSYCFAYRVGDGQIEILRIIHTSRDLNHLFSRTTT